MFGDSADADIGTDQREGISKPVLLCNYSTAVARADDGAVKQNDAYSSVMVILPNSLIRARKEIQSVFEASFIALIVIRYVACFFYRLSRILDRSLFLILIVLNLAIPLSAMDVSKGEEREHKHGLFRPLLVVENIRKIPVLEKYFLLRHLVISCLNHYF